jgi:hypothetical protein
MGYTIAAEDMQWLMERVKILKALTEAICLYLSKKICDRTMAFKIITGQLNIYLHRKYLLFIRL